MQYQKEIREDHLVAIVNGQYEGLDATRAMMKVIAADALKLGLYKVLIDIMDIRGNFPTLLSFELGEHAAKLWGFKLKMAIAYRAEDTTGLFENVAVNRGANLRVFPSLKEAEAWLLQ